MFFLSLSNTADTNTADKILKLKKIQQFTAVNIMRPFYAILRFYNSAKGPIKASDP
jgi:hypothetical protein